MTNPGNFSSNVEHENTGASSSAGMPDLDIRAHEGPEAPRARRDPHGVGGVAETDVMLALESLRNDTEIELIRRETRFLPSLMNFLLHFQLRQWRSNPRSKAAISALLWRIFSPGTAAVVGGGLLMFILTGLQVWLLWLQNARIDQQTQIMQSQANISVVTRLGELQDEILKYADTACLVSAQANEPGAKDPQGVPNCWGSVPSSGRKRWLDSCAASSDCSAHYAIQDFLRSESSDLLGLDSLQYLAQAGLPLARPEQSKVVAMTQSARPYRFIESTSDRPATLPSSLFGELAAVLAGGEQTKLVARPLSPERGQVLVMLLRSGISLVGKPISDADFSRSFAYRARLTDARLMSNLDGVSFPRAILDGAVIAGSVHHSDFWCASFDRADLRKVIIFGGIFYGAVFSEVKLPTASNFNPANLIEADFRDAEVEDGSFLEQMGRKGIVGFNPNHWRLEAAGNRFKIKRQANHEPNPECS